MARSLPWLFTFVLLTGAQGPAGSVRSLLLALVVLLACAKLAVLAAERLVD